MHTSGFTSLGFSVKIRSKRCFITASNLVFRCSDSVTGFFRLLKHPGPLLLDAVLGWGISGSIFALCFRSCVSTKSCIVLIQDMVGSLTPAELSAAGRSLRSRLAQLASGQQFLRGTLSERSSK